jgi:hypothetical protein
MITKTTQVQQTSSTTPTLLIMDFTGAELDILYALIRQESNQLDKKYGFKTEPQKGSYWELVQKLERKLSENKVLRRF